MGWFGRKSKGQGHERSRETNPLMLALFGLPFLGVGIALSVVCVSSLAEAKGMRAWREVPATILETDLETHSDSDGGTTYRVTATYEYEWEGKKYRGNRVGIHTASDNIGSFHHDTHGRLESCRANGRKFPCYVNPARPAQSILLRGVRWEVLALNGVLALVFASAGLGLMVGGLVLRGRNGGGKALKAAHPGEPWLWKPVWSGGEIRSSNRMATQVLGAVAVFWNLVAIPLAAFAFLDGYCGEGNKLALLALIFPAIGLALAWAAAVQLARLLRFGESVFRMTPFPGVVGGKVSGVVHAPVHLRPEDGFLVTLRCQHTYDSGDSTVTETVWEAQRKLVRELLERDLKRSAIPILFTVPYACRPTNDEARIAWQLEVKARTDHGRYESKFEIPVFRTDESSQAVAADESAISGFEDKNLFKENCAANRIVVNERTDGGREFVFPSRWRHATTGFVVCGVAMAGAVLARYAGGPVLVAVGVGLAGVLLGGAMAAFWLRPSRVAVRHGAVTVRRSVAGIAFERTIPARSVASVEVFSKTQAGNSRYYAIRIVATDGASVVAACTLEGRAFVDELAAQIRLAIEREKDGSAR